MGNPHHAKYMNAIGIKSIFYFCSLPLRYDPYLQCSFGCTYCFSQNSQTHTNNGFRIADPAELEHRLAQASSSRTTRGPIGDCFHHRVPLHIGGLSDPCQPAEKSLQVTYRSLVALRDHGYPTVISTKGTLFSDPSYLDLLVQMPYVACQFSFSTFDDHLARRIEPQAPPPSERLRTMRVLADEGVWVGVRLQPLLYPICEIEDYDFALLAQAGAKHVVVEHLRIPSSMSRSALEAFNAATGIDWSHKIIELGGKRQRRSLQLPPAIKIRNNAIARSVAHSLGMGYGCGDNDLHHMSDHFCCCGVGKLEGFEHIYDGHLNRVVMDALSSGELRAELVEKSWHPSGSMIRRLNRNCRNGKPRSMCGMILSAISDPNHGNSISDFYGISHDLADGCAMPKLNVAVCGEVRDEAKGS